MNSPQSQVFSNDDFEVRLPGPFRLVTSDAADAPVVLRSDGLSLQLTVRVVGFNARGDQAEVERRGHRVEQHFRQAISQVGVPEQIEETVSTWVDDVHARRFSGHGGNGTWTCLLLCTPLRVLTFFLETPHPEDAQGTFRQRATTVMNSIRLRQGRVAH